MSTRFSVFPQASATLLIALGLAGCGVFSPRTEATFLKKGRDRLAAKDYSRGLLEFRNARKLAPQDGEPHYQIGLTYLAAGDFRSAVDSLRKCLSVSPQHIGARLKLAEMMTSSG